MKIFSWMQNKLKGKQATKQPNVLSYNHNRPQASFNEEFSDWPQALFAIGTFGNSSLKEDPERLNPKRSQASCQDDQTQEIISPEEIKELQKELSLLLDKPISSGDESGTHNSPIEELEETVCEEDSVSTDSNALQRSGSLVLSRGKDIFLDNTNNAIGKRSLSFILKKIFICSSGFSHVPNLRDSLPEAKIEKSRMEKLLRTILHKKIYPQSSNPKAIPKNYLEGNNMSASDNIDSDDEMPGRGNDGSKWVKTDSEYIVLEI